MNLTKPISLVGIMGAGKSSFGKKISKKLAIPFFDIDNEIKIKSGYSTKEIFNCFGENKLKETEFSIIQETLNKTNAIIATGDCIADNEKAWEYLKENSIIVWLNLDLRLIAQRLKPNDDRPHLMEDAQDMLQVVTALYRKRAKQYKQAHIKIYQPNLSKKKFLQKLNKFQTKNEEQQEALNASEPSEKHIKKQNFLKKEKKCG